jgi:hypothetical protein
MPDHAACATGMAPAGIGFGSAFAIIISKSSNQSEFGAIIHRIQLWIYVTYYVLKYQDMMNQIQARMLKMIIATQLPVPGTWRQLSTHFAR